MSFLRKGMMVSGGQMLCVSLGVGANILFARALGRTEMGQLELFRSTAVVIAASFSLGFGPANVYFLNNQKVPMQAVVTNAAKQATMMALIIILALAITVPLMSGYFGHVVLPVALLYAVGVGLDMIRMNLRPILVAKLEVRRYVMVAFVPGVVVLTGAGCVMLWRLFYGTVSADAAIFVLALGGMTTGAMSVFFLRKEIDLRLPFDWRLTRRVFSYGVKLAAVMILAMLSQNLSVMLLRLRLDAFEEVSLYTRAVAICGLLLLVPVGVGPLLYARWSSVTGEVRRKQGEMALRLHVAYGLACMLLVMALGKYVIWFLYGKEYIGGAVALRWLAPAVLCMLIFKVGSGILGGAGKAGITAWVLLVSISIMAVVTYFSVPILGINGAAIGVLCGNAFSILVVMALCARLYGIRLSRCLIPTRRDFRSIRDSLRK